jgi:SAM-dependent methyltransferase
LDDPCFYLLISSTVVIKKCGISMEDHRIDTRPQSSHIAQLDSHRIELHSLWSSWSWRLFRPLRNIARRMRGYDAESEPSVNSVDETRLVINAIHRSLSWRLTGPLRIVHSAFIRHQTSGSDAVEDRASFADQSCEWNHLKPLIERVAARLGVSAAVHPQDHIFRFIMEHPQFESDEAKVEYYFADGAKSARQFFELLHQYCGEIRHKPQVLEFASGYGCVTRHLIHDRSIELESCDIHPAALDFLRDEIGVRALPSSRFPEDVSFPHHFDFVFALSFFSHMPIATWTRWLVRLSQCLKPGGVLAFTTHGMASRVLADNPEIPEPGFWFKASSEQADLSGEEYGTSIVTEAFVRKSGQTIASVEMAEVRPAYWWGHQDLYVLRRLERP